jgi:hypothetical protein
MGDTAVNTGTGTTITFSSGFVANVRSLQRAGVSRAVIETTGLATADARTFMGGDLIDNGTMQITMAYLPATAPPMTGAATAFTLTYPAGTTEAGNCFLSDWSAEIPIDELMTISCTLRITGPVTRTAN